MRDTMIGPARRLVILMVILAVPLAGCADEESQVEPKGQVPSADGPVVPAGPGADGETRGGTSGGGEGPEDTTLKVTVESMERVREATVPDTHGEDEEALKNNAAIHLEGTGFPWEEEANVYLAGHRLGYEGTDSFLAFYDIDEVGEGDRISVTDADGERYAYEVFEVLEVDATDLSVVEPVEGKNVLTLQTCTLPDYSGRVIVRAELEKDAA